jgi:hypothetical protein
MWPTDFTQFRIHELWEWCFLWCSVCLTGGAGSVSTYIKRVLWYWNWLSDRRAQLPSKFQDDCSIPCRFVVGTFVLVWYRAFGLGV